MSYLRKGAHRHDEHEASCGLLSDAVRSRILGGALRGRRRIQVQQTIESHRNELSQHRCGFGARRTDSACASSPEAANEASTAFSPQRLQQRKEDCKHKQLHPTDAPSKQCACVLRLLPLTPFISPAAPNQVALHASSVHGTPFLHQAGFDANYQSRTPTDVSCPSCSS